MSTELNPLDVASWECCGEHETTYLKDLYCKECRIADLEAENNAGQKVLDGTNEQLDDSLKRIADLESQLKDAHEGWDQDDEKHQKQLERVRGLPVRPAYSEAGRSIEVVYNRELKAAIKGDES